MDPDSLRKAWQAHSSQTHVTVDAELLLQEVQRNQQTLRAVIFRRDFLEVGLGLLMLPFWFYAGRAFALPWTWYLGVPALIWGIGFFVVDRMRHPHRKCEPDEPLLSSVQESLTQVEHQIWLLRNVFWWYLLPFAIPMLAFMSHVVWLTAEGSWSAIFVANSIVVAFVLAVCNFLNSINQNAVRTDLEPRRQELLTLLASLSESDSAREEPTSVSPRDVETSGMLRQWFYVAASFFLALTLIVLASGWFDSSYAGPPQSSGPAGEPLASLVADLREKNGLVGLAAMVMVDGQIEAAAAHGQRKQGSGVPVEIADRWHLGGIAKSITATMIARLVESGQMQWSNTVGDCFSEGEVHEDWKPVTLKQLLTDTAGAPANFPREVRRNRPPLGPECTATRREAVLGVIASKPLYRPGSRFDYSNVGCTIASAMAEQATGFRWEELVEREVFEPLELAESGFGPPRSGNKTLEQPRGHRTRFGWKIAVGDTTDNTSIMAPSGMIHMSLHDLCTYAGEHLRGEAGEGTLLATETYQELHTLQLGLYAYGWLRLKPGVSIPRTTYWHNGSNTLWYALVVFIPDKNMVVAVTSNDGDSKRAESAAWEIVKASANQFNIEGDTAIRQTLPSRAFPKKSPFAAVRWQENQPEVQVGGEWYRLVSINDVPAEDIVAFSRKTYAEKWQKRFEEDLVELLWRMEHSPGDTVKLVVMSLTSPDTHVLQGIPMTREDRRAIRAAAQVREHTRP